MQSEGLALFALMAPIYGIFFTDIFGGPLMTFAWLIVHVLSDRRPVWFALANAIVGAGFGAFAGFEIVGFREIAFFIPTPFMAMAGAAIG